MISNSVPKNDPFGLVALYKGSGNRQFLERAMALAEKSGNPGAVAYVSMQNETPLGYNDKLAALKYAIVNQAGSIYETDTPIGGLYRELFWDDDVDRLFYIALPRERAGMEKLILQTVLQSRDVEDGDCRITDYYRDLIATMVSKDLSRGGIHPLIRPLSESVDMFCYVKAHYLPVMADLLSTDANQTQTGAKILGRVLGIAVLDTPYEKFY